MTKRDETATRPQSQLVPPVNPVQVPGVGTLRRCPRCNSMIFRHARTCENCVGKWKHIAANPREWSWTSLDYRRSMFSEVWTLWERWRLNGNGNFTYQYTSRVEGEQAPPDGVRWYASRKQAATWRRQS